MDDDYGCMSSWFALTVRSLYQICPRQMTYQFFSPIFNKVTLQLSNRKTFKNEARNYDNISYCIQSATLDGKTYKKTSIQYRDIMNRGKLVYNMSNQPEAE